MEAQTTALAKPINWRRVSTFVPALWIAPQGARDPQKVKECIGKYIVGVLEKYEAKDDPRYGNKNHFYQMMVSETSETVAHVYQPNADGTGAYADVPVRVPELYSIKASGLLHHILQKYWNDPDGHYGQRLRIEYTGAKEIDVDNPAWFQDNSKPKKIKAMVHQFVVDEDGDFVPNQLAGPAAPEQIEHLTSVPVEEPLPNLPEE